MDKYILTDEMKNVIMILIVGLMLCSCAGHNGAIAEGILDAAVDVFIIDPI